MMHCYSETLNRQGRRDYVENVVCHNYKKKPVLILLLIDLVV